MKSNFSVTVVGHPSGPELYVTSCSAACALQPVLLLTRSASHMWGERKLLSVSSWWTPSAIWSPARVRKAQKIIKQIHLMKDTEWEKEFPRAGGDERLDWAQEGDVWGHTCRRRHKNNFLENKREVGRGEKQKERSWELEQRMKRESRCI